MAAVVPAIEAPFAGLAPGSKPRGFSDGPEARLLARLRESRLPGEKSSDATLRPCAAAGYGEAAAMLANRFAKRKRRPRPLGLQSGGFWPADEHLFRLSRATSTCRAVRWGAFKPSGLALRPPSMFAPAPETRESPPAGELRIQQIPGRRVQREGSHALPEALDSKTTRRPIMLQGRAARPRRRFGSLRQGIK